MARSQPALRPIARVAWLVAALCSACTDPLRFPYVLTDEPVVVGVSVAVIEDGPYAADVASLPADRPRAEVLPLDTVELDALVVDIDGPRELDDAAWVLCGDGCLASLAAQGDRYGELEPCAEDSAARSYACLAGRGARPRVVMPAIVPNLEGSFVVPRGTFAFLRVAVIVGSPGGPSTDECLEQLLGRRSELWGCAIGVRELPYGPPWALRELLEELVDAQGTSAFGLSGVLRQLALELDYPPLPAIVTQFLAPNAAPRIEAMRVGPWDDMIASLDPSLEPQSVDEPIEIEAGAELVLQPIVSPRDQQLVLQLVGPDSWVGSYEWLSMQGWSDAPLGRSFGSYRYSGVDLSLRFDAPEEEGPVRLYLLMTDSRNGVSWLTLDLQVVAR